MLTVNSIKSESKQGVELFYFGSGEVAAMSRDIKRISNESKNSKYDAGPVVRKDEIEVLNPLYESCRVEAESSLYDSASVENYRITYGEYHKLSEAKIINRGDEIIEIKEIVERVNSGIEFFPSIHAFAQDIFEAKFKVEQLAGTSEVFPSPPGYFIEPHELNPRNSILIPESYLFKLMTSLNNFCEKLSLSNDVQHSA